MTKIAASLITIALLGACQTPKTTKRETLRQMHNRYASNSRSVRNEPAPPAEGPGDVPGQGPADLHRNPALVPSPLLRSSAIGGP